MVSERQLTPTERAWKVKDPKAEKYKSTSPYAYVLNNPMKFVDPNGEEVKDVTIANRSAYKTFKSTTSASTFLQRLQGGDMQQHTLEFISAKNPSSVLPYAGQAGSAGIYLIDQGKQIPLFNVTPDNIHEDCRLYARIKIANNYNEASEILTIGHEVLIHTEGKMSEATRILNSNMSASKKAEALVKVANSANIYYNGEMGGNYGDVEHSKIVTRSNKSYEQYKREVTNRLDGTLKTNFENEARIEYNQYSKNEWIQWYINSRKK